MNAWRNLITHYTDEPVADLIANEQNWRTHPKAQRDAMRGVLQEVGIVLPLLKNDRFDRLIDGHLRLELAQEDGIAMFPVAHIDQPIEVEREILATLDPISALATTDAAKLDELLRDVQSGEAGVQAMLAELAERNGVIPPTFDASSEWAGMPEFEQDDLMAAHRVVVNFARDEDLEQFERLVGQEIPKHVKNAGSIWFPKVDPLHVKHLGFVSDES